MLTRKARIWVIAIGFILLFWTLYEQVYEISAVIGIGIGLLVWGYFREGTVVMAARKFHEKNYEAAEELLQEIKDPDRLSRHRRGFYEFIYGNLELHRQNYSEAEKHFQIASRFPLRNQNDKAIVLVHLANLNLRKKDRERAIAYVEKAKTFKITSRVRNIIENIQKEINLQKV
jgi:tetratricopeptide (TPR) repeat protein